MINVDEQRVKPEKEKNENCKNNGGGCYFGPVD
jgi:hypothetical protein